jgi:glutamate dehydrogenase/leucine dehydrogenase
MLSTVTKLINQSAKRLDLKDSDLSILLTPNKVHEFTIKLKNGKEFKAYRSQHNNLRGPYKGGIRFHPDVNKDEVIALSILMSLKTALAGLPLGGGKGGIAVNPNELSSKELEELSRLYVDHLVNDIGPDKDIPAPDVNTNPLIIGWMEDEYKKLTGDISGASFTGKSLHNGGSAGREEATGRGGFIVTKEILNKADIIEPSYALQGFGNVGMHFALTAQELDKSWNFNTVSDSKSAIESLQANGFDAFELAKFKQQTHELKGFKESHVITQEELITKPNVVLVLAALGGVINNSNANQIDTDYIVELANGPITDEAAKILNSKNVTIVPDILANAGGVIVSYFEWRQNHTNEYWDIDTVNQKLDKKLIDMTSKVLDYQSNSGLSLKEASIDVAIIELLKSRY